MILRNVYVSPCLSFKTNGITRFLALLWVCCLLQPLAATSQDSLYNNSYTIACHNCYEKKYSSGIGDVLSYTTTLEIDIWDMPLLFKKGGVMANDWYVKHTFLEKGNKNSFGGSLASCLTEIANWSDRHPDHNVITVFLDKKQGWSGTNGTRSPYNLDNLIVSVFGKDKIYTPNDLADKGLDLRTALREHNWASLNKLKGKIIFIITDATFFRPRNSVLDKYLKKMKESAVCFVAPTIKKQCEVTKPKGISAINTSDIIFYNLNYKNSHLCPDISSNNYVNRVFRAPETTKEVMDLTSKKVNFVAMFNYKLAGKLNEKVN